jgi:hypothetical protein
MLPDRQEGGSMARKWITVAGWALAVAGFVLALVSLALPWARFRVSADIPGQGGAIQQSGNVAVFQIDRGIWYVIALLCLFGALGAAAVSQGRAARAAGVAAVVLAVAGMIITSMVAGDVTASAVGKALGNVQLETSAAVGITYGLVALPLLALGAALLSVRTPAR